MTFKEQFLSQNGTLHNWELQYSSDVTQVQLHEYPKYFFKILYVF